MKEQVPENFPVFESDQDAEEFVDSADLSRYDFSGFKTARYEFEPKNTTVTLRLPENLLAAVKAKALQEGMPYTRFIRMVLEKAV